MIFFYWQLQYVFFLDFRSRSHFRGPGESLRTVTWLCDVESNIMRCFLDFLSHCTWHSLMLLYAHALLEFVTKKYHKRERTTSTANIKVKSSLLAYNISLLAAVTPRACVVGICHKEVPQGWAYHIHCKYKGELFHCTIEHISWLPLARSLPGVWELVEVLPSGCTVTSCGVGSHFRLWGHFRESGD